MILSAGKGGKTALVIGVQSADASAVPRYANRPKNWARMRSSRFPRRGSPTKRALLAYYQEVGKMTSLPLFAQAVGAMSVDLLVEMFKTIPTMRYIKDEAGNPLERIGELRERTGDQLKVFSGAGGATLIAELERGFSGTCPYTGLADVFAAASICGRRARNGKRTTCSEGFRPSADHPDQFTRHFNCPRSIQARHQKSRDAGGREAAGRRRQGTTAGNSRSKRSAPSWTRISSPI